MEKDKSRRQVCLVLECPPGAWHSSLTPHQCVSLLRAGTLPHAPLVALPPPPPASGTVLGTQECSVNTCWLIGSGATLPKSLGCMQCLWGEKKGSGMISDPSRKKWDGILPLPSQRTSHRSSSRQGAGGSGDIQASSSLAMCSRARFLVLLRVFSRHCRHKASCFSPVAGVAASSPSWSRSAEAAVQRSSQWRALRRARHNPMHSSALPWQLPRKG